MSELESALYDNWTMFTGYHPFNVAMIYNAGDIDSNIVLTWKTTSDNR
jgi:hypothetical protein